MVLTVKEHPVFKREGADLLCTVKITLREAICGFSKILLKHLDGRGIHVSHPAGHVIKPGMLKRVPHEGMPIYKRSDDHGDLYIQFDVEFPENMYASPEQIKAIEGILPKPPTPMKSSDFDIVDECALIPGEMESFGKTGRSQNAYEEDEEESDEDEHGGISCTQQ